MAAYINKYGEVCVKCRNSPELVSSAWREVVTNSFKQIALMQLRVKLKLGMRGYQLCNWSLALQREACALLFKRSLNDLAGICK